MARLMCDKRRNSMTVYGVEVFAKLELGHNYNRYDKKENKEDNSKDEDQECNEWKNLIGTTTENRIEKQCAYMLQLLDNAQYYYVL